MINLEKDIKKLDNFIRGIKGLHNVTKVVIAILGMFLTFICLVSIITFPLLFIIAGIFFAIYLFSEAERDGTK